MTDPNQEKLTLAEMLRLKEEIPRMEDRFFWAIGGALAGFGLGYLLGTLYFGIYWLPGVGWDSIGLVAFQFFGSFAIGLIGMVAGAVSPGRPTVATILIAHCLGASLMAFFTLMSNPASVYTPHYLATAAVFGAIAYVILRPTITSPLDEFREKTSHAKPGAPSDD
jgi:hypothetical protein